jgi:hypothetical protein
LSELLVNAPNLTSEPVVIKNWWNKTSGRRLGTTHMPANFLIKSQADYNLLAQYFDLTPLLSSGEEPSASELVYKGEGSVTFTCYDPYAHSEQKRISGLTSASNTFTLGGDLPTPCLLTHLG